MDQSNEEKASNLGWVPKEHFRGDPEKWVDADTFVERGEHIMPILRKNNEKLQGELSSVRGELQQIAQLFSASQEAIAELKKFHSEDTVRQVEKAKKELLGQLKQAKEDGDVGLEVEIGDQLADLREAQRDAGPVVKKTAALPPPPQPADDPAFKAWVQDNPWFLQDRKRTALTIAAAEELRADPKNVGLLGREFYQRAADEASEFLDGPKTRSSKVEGAGGSAGRGSGGGRGRAYSDLPSDAKEACTQQAKKLVGPGRAFKDLSTWQAHYVEQYFLGE